MSVFFLPSTNEAVAVTVNSIADPGYGTCDVAECTLREAIDFASPGDTIDFDLGITVRNNSVIGDGVVVPDGATVN